MANSVDPDQTATIVAVCSGFTLFASKLKLVYFHLDKGHCLAETGPSPIYNKVRDGRRWLCILFSLLSFDLNQ